MAGRTVAKIAVQNPAINKLMSLAEENRLQLIANEISLGFTFMESSRLAYSMGHTEHGQKAHAKAEAAYSGAKRYLESENSGSAEDLRNELGRLRSALDCFQASLE